MPTLIHSAAEVEPLIARVRRAADETVRRTRNLLGAETDSLAVLYQMKFSALGRHPLEERDINLIEQVNQTWTCLVSLKAVTFLFERHPDAGGFHLNLGTKGGTDIISFAPDVVAAEAFAAVKPRNNQKLRKDIAKLVSECPSARARYVFFNAPGYAQGRQKDLESLTAPEIEVWGINV